MPILFKCPECLAVLSVSDELAGLEGRCKSCSVVVAVPTKSDPSVEPPKRPAESAAAEAPPARPANFVLTCFRRVLFAGFLALSLMRLIHYLQQPSEEEVEMRMEENAAEMERRNSTSALRDQLEQQLRNRRAASSRQ